MRQTVILVAILSLDHIILITAYATYTGELLMGYFNTIRTWFQKQAAHAIVASLDTTYN